MDMSAPPTVPVVESGLKWRWTPVRLALALTLAALALRLVNLGGRNLWLDEAFSAWFSAQSFEHLWTVLPTYEAHPPFYYSLLKLWRSVFGDSAVALRMLSVLLGALTVPVVIAAAFEQERQSPSGHPMLRATLVGCLAAASPMLMSIGQEARPYPLLTFGYALSILALLRLFRQFGNGGSGSWPAWLLVGAAAEATAWSHGLGVIYGACLALALQPAWLRGPVPRERIVRGTVTAVVVALLYLPCLMMVQARAGDWDTNWLAWNPAMLLELFSLYALPYQVLTAATALAAIGMLLLLKRGLDASLQRRGWNSDRAMLVLWLGPPLLAALISWLVVPVFLARTLAGTLIPAYLAIGSGIALTKSPRERRYIPLAICLALVPLALMLAMRGPAERWDQVSAYLSRNVSPADQVWLYPSDSALPLSHVGPIPGTVRAVPAPFPTLGVDGPVRAGWPAMVSVTPEQARRFAEDPALKTVPIIWLVSRQPGIFDPDGDMPAALARVRRPGPAQSWGYISVQPYYLH